MAVSGNAGSWSDLFDDGLIPDILELVVTTWQNIPKPQPAEYEVPINRRFAEKLRQEKNRRYDLPFKIRSETSIPDEETGKEMGRIDILFDPIYTHREEVYFAFECKRLRIPYKNKMATNTSEYVGKDGMMCFVTGKYSAGLTSGGMIGYVMDGNVPAAIDSVKASINKNRNTLCLVSGSSLSKSSMMTRENWVKETKHDLPARNFILYHIFLGV